MTTIEVFSVVWCPFAHVGLRTLVARRQAAGRADLPLRLRAWPLELVNQAPQDPAVAAAHVADLRAQVAPGLFAGFDPNTFPRTTLPALALTHAAYRVSDAVGEALGLALRTALFEEGREISDPAVLAAIAGRLGVQGPATAADHEAVLGDWREGDQRRVQGSPHLFCGARSAFCPSLDIAKDADGDLHVRPDPAALDEFLDGCFTS